jgi:hypothetical protein
MAENEEISILEQLENTNILAQTKNILTTNSDESETEVPITTNLTNSIKQT